MVGRRGLRKPRYSQTGTQTETTVYSEKVHRVVLSPKVILQQLTESFISRAVSSNVDMSKQSEDYTTFQSGIDKPGNHQSTRLTHRCRPGPKCSKIRIDTIREEPSMVSPPASPINLVQDATPPPPQPPSPQVLAVEEDPEDLDMANIQEEVQPVLEPQPRADPKNVRFMYEEYRASEERSESESGPSEKKPPKYIKIVANTVNIHNHYK